MSGLDIYYNTVHVFKWMHWFHQARSGSEEMTSALIRIYLPCEVKESKILVERGGRLKIPRRGLHVVSSQRIKNNEGELTMYTSCIHIWLVFNLRGREFAERLSEGVEKGGGRKG